MSAPTVSWSIGGNSGENSLKQKIEPCMAAPQKSTSQAPMERPVDKANFYS